MADHHLIVPPVGLLEVIHSDHRIDDYGSLVDRGNVGQFSRLTHDGLECTVTVSWMIDPTGRLNPRAQTVFADLSRIHMVFTGAVMFTGIPEDLMGEIVGRLSLRTAGGDTP